MNRDQRAECRLTALDLLAGERLADEVEAGTAVLLGNDDPEDAELRHPLDRIQVEVVVDVVLDGVRQDPVVHELADGVLQEPLLVCELEIHDGLVYGRFGRCRCPHHGHPAGADAAAEGGARRRLGPARPARRRRRDRAGL